MIPAIEDYKILSMDGKYYVLNPYDLFAMPSLEMIPIAFASRNEAGEHMDLVFKNHMQEYNRLKKMGCSFPYND
jgi:hypothetical protein